MTEDDWINAWKSVLDAYDALCMDIMNAIADGRTLDDVLDIVGDSMNSRDHVDEESVELFDKAKRRLSHG